MSRGYEGEGYRGTNRGYEGEGYRGTTVGTRRGDIGARAPPTTTKNWIQVKKMIAMFPPLCLCGSYLPVPHPCSLRTCTPAGTFPVSQ